MIDGEITVPAELLEKEITLEELGIFVLIHGIGQGIIHPLWTSVKAASILANLKERKILDIDARPKAGNKIQMHFQFDLDKFSPLL